MPSDTILDEHAVCVIEARRARCLDNKNQSRLAEASILIASDIPALCDTVKHLRAERLRLLNLVRYCRHELLDNNLITRDEFVSLLNEGSAAHLETYDELQSQLEQLRVELAEEKRLRSELKQIAQTGIAEVSSVGTALKDIALIDFRSRAKLVAGQGSFAVEATAISAARRSLDSALSVIDSAKSVVATAAPVEQSDKTPSVKSNRQPHPFQEHPLYPNYCAFAVGDEDYCKREADNAIHQVKPC